MIRFNIMISALCITAAFAGLSGCKKNAPEPAPEAPAPEAQTTANNDAKPDIPNGAANAAAAEAPAPRQNVDAKPQSAVVQAPLPEPVFDEQSLANARVRAETKQKSLPCPKGAKFKDGLCVCPEASGLDAERKKCNLKPKAYPLFSEDFRCVPNFWECFQTVMCVNPNGCHTADGMHYGPYYSGAYIVGGVDTSIASFIGSECVLDRTDGIPLFSARTEPNSDFACDRDFCPCAAETCILGEICKGGKCSPDNSPLPQLNDENSMEVEADSLPEYIAGMPDRTFDTFKCSGGKLYCHGKGMPPMVSPGDDYRCKVVASLPGIHRSGLMAWVCDSSECPCDKTKCREGDVCMNGECHHPECHGEGMPVMTPPLSRDLYDYECREVASLPGTKKPGLMAWVCQNTHGCSCSEKHCLNGGACCKEGEVCVDGACYKP